MNPLYSSEHYLFNLHTTSSNNARRIWKNDIKERVRGNDQTTNHGFIAQEVKTALDNHSEVKEGAKLWSQDPVDSAQGDIQNLSAAALIPMLTKAIQELSAKNDALEARIATLEG